nr:hypothetical protein [Burkholderia stabilis]
MTRAPASSTPLCVSIVPSFCTVPVAPLPFCSVRTRFDMKSLSDTSAADSTTLFALMVAPLPTTMPFGFTTNTRPFAFSAP